MTILLYNDSAPGGLPTSGRQLSTIVGGLYITPLRLPVFLHEAENLRGDGRGLEHPVLRCRGCPDLKRKRMEGETGETHLLAEEPEGSGGAVAAIAHHGMAGKPGVAPDLVLAAGQKVALNEGVMRAPAKDPETGLARDRFARAFGAETAPCLLGEGPGPTAPAVLSVRFGELSVEEGDITLPGPVLFELSGEVAEGFWPAGQDDDPARLPVEAVDGMNSEPGITVDFFPEVRVIPDPGLKKGAEVLFTPLLDAQPGWLLHDEPTATRREDRNGNRVCCHYSCPG